MRFVDAIEADRGSRDEGGLERRLERLAGDVAPTLADGVVVFLGSTGMSDLAVREKLVLESSFSGSAIRGFGGVTGHAMEAQFPLDWRLQR